jgi:hypothetical protein
MSREWRIRCTQTLGDLLVLLHRPGDVLGEYLVALQLSPNRLNGLLSAGAAAEAINKSQIAGRFYAAADHNTHDPPTSERPELRHAVVYAQRHGVQTHAAE